MAYAGLRLKEVRALENRNVRLNANKAGPDSGFIWVQEGESYGERHSPKTQRQIPLCGPVLAQLAQPKGSPETFVAQRNVLQSLRSRFREDSRWVLAKLGHGIDFQQQPDFFGAALAIAGPQQPLELETRRAFSAEAQLLTDVALGSSGVDGGSAMPAHVASASRDGYLPLLLTSPSTFTSGRLASPLDSSAPPSLLHLQRTQRAAAKG